MAINGLTLHAFVFALFFTLAFSSSDQQEFSPSPAPPPQLGSDDLFSAPSSSPSSSIGSPPASLPSDLSPSPSSSYSPSPSPSKSPSPSPSEDFDIPVDMSSEGPKDSSSGGMSGVKKAAVAFGVIAAACFVGFGGIVYRKRQQNIRRARYSHAARLEFI